MTQVLSIAIDLASAALALTVDFTEWVAGVAGTFFVQADFSDEDNSGYAYLLW